MNRAKELLLYRELISNLIKKQIRVRFKQSFFGIVWSVVKPAATVIILTVVFSYFAKFPSDGLPYPLFSYGALLPWTLFTTMIAAGVPSVVANSFLITKIYFPREILPLSTIIGSLLDVLISAIIFVLLLIYYKVNITLNIIYLVPVLLIEFIFGFGVVLLLSALNVWYRDVSQATAIIVQFWMYLTPIIYPLSMVPEAVRPFYVLNPMVGIIEAFRSALLKGLPPDFKLLAISGVIAILTYIVGYSVFRAKEVDFADVI